MLASPIRWWDKPPLKGNAMIQGYLLARMVAVSTPLLGPAEAITPELDLCTFFRHGWPCFSQCFECIGLRFLNTPALPARAETRETLEMLCFPANGASKKCTSRA